MLIRSTQSLSNTLITATPNLADNDFCNTVIYIYHHDKDGAMGFILNRPSQILYAYVVQQLDLEKEDFSPDTLKQPMLIGGPVNRDRGFILHLNNSSKMELVKPNNKISLKEILTESPKRSEFFFGHSGWEAGQLESELSENSWQISNIHLHKLLLLPIEDRLHHVWQDIGTDFGHYSNVVGRC